MGLRQGLACLGILAAVVAAPNAVAQEHAQFYPEYAAPGYYPPPPPPPPPPPYQLGGRCDAWAPTTYGSGRLICDIIRPRPLGLPCICPPPLPPPGYAPGPYLNGRVIP